MVKLNDVKKGTPLIANGFKGRMMDNRKGNIRMVEVAGMCGLEIGSVYAKDISSVFVDGRWQKVDRSDPKDKKYDAMLKNAGF